MHLACPNGQRTTGRARAATVTRSAEQVQRQKKTFGLITGRQNKIVNLHMIHTLCADRHHVPQFCLSGMTPFTSHGAPEAFIVGARGLHAERAYTLRPMPDGPGTVVVSHETPSRAAPPAGPGALGPAAVCGQPGVLGRSGPSRPRRPGDARGTRSEGRP